MSPKQIALITDSTCDLPSSILEEYGIIVVSHYIIWGQAQYRDRVDLQPEDFYRRLAVDKTMPTTSQATVADFAAAYHRAYEAGAEQVLAMVVSGRLSGAIRSAQQAAEEAQIPVQVYDSRGATMSLGWQVLAAARKYAAGGDLGDMIGAAESVRGRVQLQILLDTLEYVYRGGRIGNARRLVGAMLNIKPMIYIDHQTGIVEAGGMAMTRRKGLEMLFDKFFGQMDTRRPMHVAVLHGDAAADAEALYAKVAQQCHPAEMLTNITTPTLGINTGPLAIALAGYSEE